MTFPVRATPLVAPWRPPVTGRAGPATVAVVRTVAERLRAPDRLAEAVRSASKRTDHPRSVHWRAEGLWQGSAGLAVLFSQLDRVLPDEGWDALAHEHLTLAVDAIGRRPHLGLGLSRGLAGVAFAAGSASRDGTRYQRLLASLDRALVSAIPGALARLAPGPTPGVPTARFDVISGLSGVGRYLLDRIDDPSCRRAVEDVLTGLVQLVQAGPGPLRWHTPADLLPEGATRAAFPSGALNCGLAHGVPGPLALLSLATSAGVEVEGQADAIAGVSEWLLRHQLEDEWGVTWPTMVPLRAATARPVPSRTAWCYGSPGIARSLWLAGRAVGEPRYGELATRAMDAVHRRPAAQRHIEGPTICHGIAGLQQVTLRFAADTGAPAFVAAANTLHEQLLAAFEPATLLGYRNLEPAGTRIDQPGLLDGAAGVVLVLVAATTAVEPRWDAALMLS